MCLALSPMPLFALADDDTNWTAGRKAHRAPLKAATPVGTPLDSQRAKLNEPRNNEK